jgi:hypothetical protein
MTEQQRTTRDVEQDRRTATTLNRYGKNVYVKPPHGPLPGVFDLRHQLGRAPTVAEYRQSRGYDR